MSLADNMVVCFKETWQNLISLQTTAPDSNANGRDHQSIHSLNGGSCLQKTVQPSGHISIWSFQNWKSATEFSSNYHAIKTSLTNIYSESFENLPQQKSEVEGDGKMWDILH